jgi:Zn-dependent protease/predicted transcriptional regulator
MFGGSFTIARIRGIAIEIHPSWIPVVALLAWSLAEGFFPETYERWSTAAYWAVGVVSAILLFATVLVHELAHALVAVRRGLEVPKITLFFFGGVSHLGGQPRTAGEEFAIAVAGPVTSLVIAAAGALLGFLLGGLSEKVGAVFWYLAVVNVLLAVFNILPGFPLDGGRVLRSIAWNRTGSFRRATRIAGSVGELFGYALLIGGGLFLLSGSGFVGLWWMLIGWFLLNAARAESQNLQLESILGRLKAADVMHDGFHSVPPGVPLQDVVDHHMLAEGERAVVVAQDGAVQGILTVSDVTRVPRDRWANTPAQAAMIPRDKVLTVASTTPAVEVLTLLAERGFNQIPVLEEGRMVGMITRRELIERVQVAEKLAPASEPPPERPAAR